MGDPYVDPRSGVLRNKLGITSEDELRAVEADISAAALFALEASPHLGEGHFDFAHLRALHVQIFGELYTWAGKPRTVDIGKGAWFCLARNIDEFADSVFRSLADENYVVGLERGDLVRRLGALYGQLNALHPFREGNGRTQRAFLTQLGRLGGWRLRWADLDPDANNAASRRSLEAGDDSGLVELVDALLEPAPPPAVPPGVPRRVVLVTPEIAAVLPGGVEDLRRGPYPAEARCVACRVEYALAAEPTVLLLRPLPRGQRSFVFAHARCSRSRVLPAPTARELREWEAQNERGSDDAAGIAVLLEGVSDRAAFLWSLDVAFLRVAGDDVVDAFLSRAVRLGLEPAQRLQPPSMLTPGWSVAINRDALALSVVDPEGVVQFAGGGLHLPKAWIAAAAATGRLRCRRREPCRTGRARSSGGCPAGASCDRTRDRRRQVTHVLAAGGPRRGRSSAPEPCRSPRSKGPPALHGWGRG